MRHSPSQRGFTLVELLVVIAIILVASSMIFIGGGGGDGAKLSTAQRLVSGIAQGARGQAILKGAETRLIIYSNVNAEASGGDPEKWLRFFGIVYEESPGSGNWIAATQGTYLPEGIYFDPIGAPDSGSNPWPSSTMNIEYPRLSAQTGTGPQYYFYEFNSNGTMATGFENSWLVLRAGTLKGDPLAVDFSEADKENLKSALIFRRVGTTTMVSDPGAID